jgi:O-antigen ligase
MGGIDREGILLGTHMTRKIELFAQFLVLMLVFFLVNIRSFIFWTLFPDTTFPTGHAWQEVVLWLVALLLMAYLLWKSGLAGEYVHRWYGQPVLIVFLVFCIFSTGWSGSSSATLHRSLVLLFASLTGAYIGVRYSLSSSIRAMFWVCAVLLLGSLLLILLFPTQGTDLNRPYNGAWRGLFWHKNHLGGLLPFFSMVFLFQVTQWKHARARIDAIMALPMYLLSLYMLWKSNSATGYIVMVVLHLCLVGALLWLKFGKQMRAVHYYALFGLCVVVVTGILSNLDLFFGLFNRSSTLTGRIPLWQFLLSNVFAPRPWLGYGFGSTWADTSMRLFVANGVGWPYQVMIADNGFLDLLLNVGIMGLVLFLAV